MSGREARKWALMDCACLQGLAALAAAVQPQQPAVLALLPVRWELMLPQGTHVPPLLRAFVTQHAPRPRSAVSASRNAALGLDSVLALSSLS